MLSALLLSILSMGCKKSNSSISPLNVSNFEVSPQKNYTICRSVYLHQAEGTLKIKSPSLADGNYLVKYHYRDVLDTANSLSLVSVVAIKEHKGNFNVSPASSAITTFYTIDSIINTDGMSASPAGEGRQTSLSDSTGMLTCISDSAEPFEAAYVFAKSENSLFIVAARHYTSIADYNELTIQMSVTPGISGTYSLDTYAGDQASYTKYSGGITTTLTAREGTITITGFLPVISGSYSIVCTNGAKINGAFFALKQ